MTFEEEVSRTLGRVEANQVMVLNKISDLAESFHAHILEDERKFNSLFKSQNSIRTIAKMSGGIAASIAAVLSFIGIDHLLDWLNGK